MRKATTVFAAVTMLLFFFCTVQAEAQSPKKSPAVKQKNTRSQVVIEYVSFPDQYRKYDVYPWETLKLDDFQRAYAAMIEEGKFEEWVKLLSGTATNKNRMIRVSREQFVLIVSCKPHMCDSSQIIALYDPAKRHVYSVLALDGKFYWFGKPSDNIKDLLNILLVEEFKALYRGQS